MGHKCRGNKIQKDINNFGQKIAFHCSKVLLSEQGWDSEVEKIHLYLHRASLTVRFCGNTFKKQYSANNQGENFFTETSTHFSCFKTIYDYWIAIFGVIALKIVIVRTSIPSFNTFKIVLNKNM